MTTEIPDDVVEKALDAFGLDHTGCSPQDYVDMRAALCIGVEWAAGIANPPSPKELAIAARAHEPTFACEKCGVVSYNIAPWCGKHDCPGRAINSRTNPDDCNHSDYT